ncbi:putative Late nodulin [Medicago truncatula]|uniref:Nodule Cysteine-Rich (NCR) secreted peptide n=1 Tax=Medicago truncatula TaxID=3880 RepID=A0A072U7M5_MEDTR|nr:Nodule Cysteine-Rich (NCR) secreted peptide [Medicago truncatula]RHN50940.1 putative Late nodulin [Medicago truncatula]
MAKVLNCFYHMIISVFTFIIVVDCVVICDLEKDCRQYLCIPPEFPRCIGGICRCK